MIGQNLSFRDKDRLAEVLSASRFQLKMMYWNLPTPNIQDVCGQYDAALLDQGDRIGGLLTRLAFGSKGKWTGKAFRPLSETNGEGYNAFDDGAGFLAALSMDTYIGHSYIVPGFSYILDYRSKNRGPIRWLVGELRPVSSEILLGIGTFGPRKVQLHRLRRVIPFVLVRRSHAYLPESIGESRAA